MEGAKTGERVDVFFAMRDGERFATDVKLKIVSAPAGTTEIFSAEVGELIARGPEKGNYLLVDTRPPARYHEGHLPTAVSIPDTVIEKEGIAAFPEHVRANKDIALIFYCGGYT
jgi:3-mercaptopyruvate sulfurtransferase SseA